MPWIDGRPYYEVKVRLINDRGMKDVSYAFPAHSVADAEEKARQFARNDYPEYDVHDVHADKKDW